MIPPQMSASNFPAYNGPMGTFPLIPSNPPNYNGMGYAQSPPIPPNGFSMATSQISQTNFMNQGMNNGLMMSNVSPFPQTMNGYETGIATSMSQYQTNNMYNTGVPMMPQGGMMYPTGVVTTNSNSRVLINNGMSNSRVLIGGNGNSNSRVIIAPPIYNKAVIQQPQSRSRIQYIPYETKEVVYDTVEKREVIPIHKTITEYQQLKHIETIPLEKSVTDYYAIEYLTEYMPNVTNERVVDYIQQEVINEQVNYRPVDTQRVIPAAQLRASGAGVGVGMGGAVNTTTTTTVTAPTIATSPLVNNNMAYGFEQKNFQMQSQPNMYGQQQLMMQQAMMQQAMMQQPVPNASMVNSVYSNYSANGYAQNPINTSLFNGMMAQPMV